MAATPPSLRLMDNSPPLETLTTRHPRRPSPGQGRGRVKQR
jgi:hypothetical protein